MDATTLGYISFGVTVVLAIFGIVITVRTVRLGSIKTTVDEIKDTVTRLEDKQFNLIKGLLAPKKTKRVNKKQIVAEVEKRMKEGLVKETAARLVNTAQKIAEDIVERLKKQEREARAAEFASSLAAQRAYLEHQIQRLTGKPDKSRELEIAKIELADVLGRTKEVQSKAT